MNENHDQLIGAIARYGLPLIILVFYLTAARGFEYTPDSTYDIFQAVVDVGATRPAVETRETGTVNPLWLLFPSIGSAGKLDPLMTLKVLSLVFSCVAVIAVYLFAVEVTGDRLLAFCSSLAIAMQAWLLQSAPSGNALPLMMALSFVALFFLLRNEYLLATVPAALCTLLCWQGAALLVLLLLDLGVNSRNKRRALLPGSRIVLMFLAFLSPWLFYALLNGVPPIPESLQMNDFGVIGIGQIVAVVLLMTLVAVAVTFILRGGREDRQLLNNHVAPAAWVMWLVLASVLWTEELILVAWPVVVVYAFMAVRVIGEYTRRTRRVYSAACALTALLLVQTQLEFLTIAKPHMNASMERSEELVSIAIWLKNNAGDNASVGSGYPGLLSYYSGRKVQSVGANHSAPTDYLVARDADEDRFEVVFSPVQVNHPAVPANSAHYAVWKRR